MDLFQRIVNNPGPLGKHSERAYGYFMFPKLTGEIGPHMRFNGKTMLNWSLNDYLGLANHPEVRQVDADAAANYGMAFPMGARMMSGNSDQHEQLESDLSAFVEKPATMLLNFGYQGIMSVIDALLTRHDVAVYDAECHACIIDGLRMHVGRRLVYQHNNMESFEKQLKRATEMVEGTQGAVLVITEGVFGMSGHQGKLKEIVDFKKQFDFRLLVDDAHGFGCLGATGAGAGEAQNCMPGIDVYFSTFAKSMASIGAFVSSTPAVIDFLRYNTRSQIFAKSLPIAFVIGAIKRLELIKKNPELRHNLHTITKALQSGLEERGFVTGNPNANVTPVYLKGNDEQATHLVYDLRENYGIFCSIVVYPVIPRGNIILRITPTASHTLDDVDRTLDAFSDIKGKLLSGQYDASELPIVELVK